MNQSQEEIRRIIISDMVKKRNSIVSFALLRMSNGPLFYVPMLMRQHMWLNKIQKLPCL